MNKTLLFFARSLTRDVRRPKGLRVLGLALLLLLAGSVSAQSTDGSLVGTVTDQQGAVISDATISVRNTDTGLTQTRKTGADGQFRIVPLPTGTYELKVEHEGFSSSTVKNLTVTLGSELQRDVTLTTGSVDQQVTVSASEALIPEPTSSQSGTALISEAQINTLPVAGRQATQLSLLLPGTGTDSTRAQRPDANVGVGSANVAATNYLVDGLTNMISGAGDPRDNIQQASIQEFKVILSQTPAEYGGRSGGVVTLVTKSGGNAVHGEFFEFFRNHAINRVDYYTQAQHNSSPSLFPIQPFSRNQFGGAVGGPILKNKLHYFASFERLDDREYFTVAPGGASATPAVQTDYAALQGSFRNGSQQNSYFGRIDWQINAKHNTFLKFFEQNPSIFYCLGCAGGNNAAFSSGDTGVQGWTWAAGDTWIISPRVVNQFSAQVAQDWQTSLPSKFNTPSQDLLNRANLSSQYIPAGIGIAPGGSTVYNFPSLKWGFYPGTQFHPFYQEAFDTITIATSHHTFKFGADALNQPRKTQAAATPLGAWTFKNDIYFNPSDPKFDWSSLKNAVPTKFTTTVPTIPYINYNLELAWFGQDEWKLRPNLTLNLGLRYDLQTGVWVNKLNASLYPKPLPYVTFGGHGVHDNVAPRVGFAWDPWKNGKTVVRGGYGIVYTMNSNNTYGYETATLRQTSISITNPTYPDPYNGKGYQNYISTAPPNIAINSNKVSNPPVYTYNLGVARALTNDISLNVDGIYSRITQMPINVNVNTPNPVTSVNPLTDWGQINEVEPIGVYGYRALFFRLDKRQSHHYQYTVSYTLAKQRDNYNGNNYVTDFYHPTLDLGTSSVDRRHVLVLSGSTQLKYGITLGGIYSIRSALPLSATTGIDNNKDGQTSDYVPGTLKNEHNFDRLLSQVNAWRSTQSLTALNRSQLQSSFYNQLDMRVSKQFNLTERYKLQAIGQLFNVFGTDNFGGVGASQQSNASAATFGQILSAYPRQQGELAVRFLF